MSAKQCMISRFRYLWTWELFNALIAFPGLLFVMGANIHIGHSALLATAGVCVLLIIGSVFSFIKYRDLKNGTRNIVKDERPFRLLRQTIPFLLLGMALMIYFQSRISNIGNILLSIALFVLAILEYINYFQFQLMYDTRRDIQYLTSHRRLKRGLIAREFGW